MLLSQFHPASEVGATGAASLEDSLEGVSDADLLDVLGPEYDCPAPYLD